LSDHSIAKAEQMKLNSFQFPDRSRVETFSQKQQQLIVNQQTPAIPANQVTGSTGQPFVAVSSQSMIISTNGATDLVGGQIQMAINVQNLQATAVQADNTYVAMLSPDRQTWMIQETMRTVNRYVLALFTIRQG
jgi:membrane protease subunit (stomatin/prohibitin family)